MKLKLRHGLILIVMVSIIGSAQLGWGAGFALYEGSARGNALGGVNQGQFFIETLFKGGAGFPVMPADPLAAFF